LKTDFTTISDMTPEQRAKLPSYVRQHIERLERLVHETETILYDTWSVLGPRTYEKHELTDKRHEEGIIVGPNGAHPLAVHENMEIRFWIGKEHYDVRIIRNRPGPSLQLMASSSLSIMPSSSNVAYVKGGNW